MMVLMIIGTIRESTSLQEKIKGEITTENNAKDNIALSNYNNDLGALVIKMGEEKQHRTDNTH